MSLRLILDYKLYIKVFYKNTILSPYAHNYGQKLLFLNKFMSQGKE